MSSRDFCFASVLYSGCYCGDAFALSRTFLENLSPSLLSEQKDTFEILQAKKRSADTLAELGNIILRLWFMKKFFEKIPVLGNSYSGGKCTGRNGRNEKALHYFEEATHMGLEKNSIFAQGTVFLRGKHGRKHFRFKQGMPNSPEKRIYFAESWHYTFGIFSIRNGA